MLEFLRGLLNKIDVYKRQVGNKSASISYAFNNCTIENFYGSNAKFSKCKIGGSYYDGINPFQNVEVTDCFISDFGSTKDTGKEIHSDGTQIYGAADAEVKNCLLYTSRCV